MTTIIYGFFAVIATIANIGSQDIVINVYQGPNNIILSILIGTFVGLITKYFLDKRFIFRFETRDNLHDSKTFLLYSLTGVATTLIFWGLEFSFQLYFKSNEMRYLGGTVGLLIGYIIKYQLDKRYVFEMSNQ
jgi:putative flippase GtrA